ncbi:MAG: ArnT family glycosyltransferase, partial [Candidatus Hodarchaeota archaeon]
MRVATFLTKKYSKHDLLIASCLFLIGLVTRIPFATRMIYHSDSVRFALAMKHYDVAQMRPHAPGYILYIAISKLFDFFIHDARVSLVGVSILSSALTLFFLYFLACEMYGRSNGTISTLALLSSPLFWLNSVMPFTYALEGFFSLVFAYTCYRAITRQKNWLILSAIILGLATGVRQHIIFLFLPLWIYTLTKCSPKQILISFLALSLTCLTWFMPMTILSGGLKNYFSVVQTQFITFAGHPDRFLFQIKGRTIIFATFIVYSLGLGIIPMLYYCGCFFRIPVIVQDIKPKFLLLWIGPSLIFFILVLIYNSGHIVFILPPLFIILAESVKAIAEDLTDGVRLVFKNNLGTFFNFLKLMASYRVILISLVVSLMF